jgi:hypothetical protein
MIADVSEMHADSNIALMMEAASASKTPVNFYQTTRRNIPEDSHLHTRSRENLKSHQVRSGVGNYIYSGSGLGYSEVTAARYEFSTSVF